MNVSAASSQMAESPASDGLLSQRAQIAGLSCISERMFSAKALGEATFSGGG